MQIPIEPTHEQINKIIDRLIEIEMDRISDKIASYNESGENKKAEIFSMTLRNFMYLRQRISEITNSNSQFIITWE